MLLLPALALLACGAAPPRPWPDKPSLLHKLEGHPNATVRGADFSPDGRTLASVCSGGVLNLWDVGSGKVRTTVKSGAFDHVEYSRDGKYLVTAGTDRVVRLFDAKAKELKKFEGHTGQVYVARFTPDGKHVVSSGIDNFTRLWEVETGKQVRSFQSGTAYALAVSPDGKYVATAGEARALTLWDLSTGQSLRKMPGHQGVVVWLAFSHDGRTLASCSYDRTTRLWETNTGKSRLVVTNQQDSPRAVRFAPGDRFFATVGYDRSTRLYLAGKELFSDTSLPEQGYALTFSRDGRHLVSGGQQGKLFVFDVSALTRKKSPGDVEMAAVTFDDHWKKLGSDDAAEAYESLLALSVPGSIRHFGRRFEPPKPLTDEAKKRTPKLISELAADEDDNWRKASDELAGYGPAIVPALKAALAKETDPDVKLRLVVTIGRADVASADQARLLRTLEALEHVGTAEAVKLVQKLAQGRGEAVTAEAKATLARMRGQ